VEKEVRRNSFVASVNIEHRFSAYNVNFSLGWLLGPSLTLITGYWKMCPCVSKIGNIGYCLSKLHTWKR